MKVFSILKRLKFFFMHQLKLTKEEVHHTFFKSSEDRSFENWCVDYLIFVSGIIKFVSNMLSSVDLWTIFTYKQNFDMVFLYRFKLYSSIPDCNFCNHFCYYNIY